MLLTKFMENKICLKDLFIIFALIFERTSTDNFKMLKKA